MMQHAHPHAAPQQPQSNPRSSKNGSRGAHRQQPAAMNSHERPAMESKSILADSYVPMSYRAINLHKVARVLPTRGMPNMDPMLQRTRETVIPYHPCICKSPGSEPGQLNAAAQHPLLRPLYRCPPDMYFAVQTYSKTLCRNQVMNPLPAVEDGFQACTDEFVATYFRAMRMWLDNERSENMILFERYSVYNHLVHVSWNTYPRSPTDGAIGPSSCLATISIPGIADARPELRIGDICLLRPMTPISLPSFMVSNELFQNFGTTVEIRSQIVAVVRSRNGQDDKVAITWFLPPFAGGMQISYPSARYNVRFVPSTQRHSSCITALQWLSSLPPSCCEALLLPSQEPLLPSNTLQPAFTAVHMTASKGTATTVDAAPRLNRFQQQLVDTTVARTRNPSATMRPPVILTGPAGTGKTKALLASIAECIKLPGVRILVCTPSHTACNVITQRLGEQLGLDQSQLFRLLDCSRPISTIPSAIIQYCCQDDTIGAFSMPSSRDLLRFSIVVCTCHDAHMLYDAGVTNYELRERRQCFHTWFDDQMDRSNLALPSNGRLRGVDQPHFTHLYFDEASQATEAESSIPLSVVVDPKAVRAAEIVLIGDPRQLSPKVYSHSAAVAGLQTPWMERLLQLPIYSGDLTEGTDMLGPQLNSVEDFVSQALHQYPLATFMSMNYRGHPAFLMMISALFYFDRLQSAKGFDEFEQASNATPETLKLRASIKTLFRHRTFGLGNVPILDASALNIPMLRCHEPRSWPIHFHGTVGKDVSITVETFCGEDSWCNEDEADSVCKIVTSFVQSGISTAKIGVMAPFRGQVVLIRRMLRKLGYNALNVGTIEDYQAVEYSVIVLSLTRCSTDFISNDVWKRIGVFRQPKRANVAMTRAEEAFVVVGNPSTMLADVVWRQWLFFCARNGLWTGAGMGALQGFVAGRSLTNTKPYMTDRDKYMEDNTKTAGFDDHEDIVVSSMERIFMPHVE